MGKKTGYPHMWISAVRSVKHKTERVSGEGENVFKVNVYIEADGYDKKTRYRAYAAVVEFKTNGRTVKRNVGGAEKATGYRILLLALISALRILTKNCQVTVYMKKCDYVTETIRKGKMYEWLSNGWNTMQNKPVGNSREWKEIIRLTEKHEIAFIIVKEHRDYKDELQEDIKKLKGQNWQQQAIGQ